MNKKVSFISLGCPKSLVDSERMLGILAENGYIICEEYSDSDAIVINTCGFIESARDESINTIKQAINMKKRGVVKKVFVTGCMVDFRKDKLIDELKDVDGFLSVRSRDSVADFLRVLWNKNKRDKYYRANNGEPCLFDRGRLRLTPKHYAYVKISEGCSNPCSFCSIPKIRGPMRSKSENQIVDEIKELVQDGVKEVILVAQDTTLYGWDIYRKSGLVGLLEKITKIEGVAWVRLLYAHPAHLTKEVIDIIAQSPKIVKYIDVPIQHISDRILFAMNRKVGGQMIKDLLYYIRSVSSEIAIRTSVIVGFPGETDKEFEELCKAIEEIKFDRLGAFIYSPEAHTPSSKFLDQIEYRIKLERFDRIMKLQEKIANLKNKGLIGKELECIIDRKHSHNSRNGSNDNFQFEGRTYMDAPEVDGVVYINDSDLKIGQIYKIKITDSAGYDLIGARVNNITSLLKS